MVRDNQAASPRAALSPERISEIDEVIGRITRWARRREDIVGLLLVGSCARNAARPDSDIDIVVLTTDEPRYLLDDAWAMELGLGELIRAQSWERSRSDAIPRPLAWKLRWASALRTGQRPIPSILEHFASLLTVPVCCTTQQASSLALSPLAR
ncbi:nucleotidyltransferase domain-containing protein [Streptomyces sp. NPDC001817]|uniref:nucleotidyltransferase domain-containing protein n=1 Tax=Streptomyces sp. NPDC001817 TaxID=3154398 RepID=UPI0033196F32